MTPLLSILLQVAPAQVALPISQSAFFCTINSRLADAGGKYEPVKPMRQFAFLLAGPAEAVSLNAPIKTFDPDGLLESKTLLVATKVAGERNYVISTARRSAPGEKMLTLDFKPQGQKMIWDLAIGNFSGERRPPDYLGFCQGAQSPKVPKLFNDFVSAGGFPR